jgi:hypothetical protein
VIVRPRERLSAARTQSRKRFEEVRRHLRANTERALNNLIQFKVSYDVSALIRERGLEKSRELEDRIHNAIRAVGVLATRDEFLGSDGGAFLKYDQPLSPDVASPLLEDFPYAAAAAAYIFTLLEGYGNEQVRLVNRRYLRDRQAGRFYQRAAGSNENPA